MLPNGAADRRFPRLELTVVPLIIFEIAITFYQIIAARHRGSTGFIHSILARPMLHNDVGGFIVRRISQRGPAILRRVALSMS